MDENQGCAPLVGSRSIEVESDDSAINISYRKFFDHLTAFADIMLPGGAKVYFINLYKSRNLYDTLT